MSHWHTLQRPWQVAFQEAVDAYLHDNSAPIGAAIVDASEMIVSTSSVSPAPDTRPWVTTSSRFTPARPFAGHRA
jgi:hypothetical protein